MATEPRISGAARGAVIVAVVLILLAELTGDVTTEAAVGLLTFPLMLFAMTQVPIRVSMLGLMFLALVLPNPAEGLPSSWLPPFATFGALMLNHMNTLGGFLGVLSICPVSGTELMFLALGVIAFQRKSSGSRIDSLGRVPTPQPLIRLAHLALVTAGFTWLSGMVRGGDFGMSLWQVNTVLYVPIVFLLFQTSVRGPKDLAAFGKVVLIAATYKALLGAYVIRAIKPDGATGDEKLAFATSHQDSVLFAVAFVILIALLIERAGRRAKWLAALIGPILVLGMMANNRRLVWVQIGLVFLTVYFVTRENAFKRMLRRALTAAAPLAAIYVAAGWNNLYSRVFKPVRIIRSVVDAKSDGSSLWRELENFNIIMTFRSNPLFGVGYGHPYLEIVQLPAVDYTLERWVPHNSLLGLWCYAGLLGFTGITLLWAAGVYFAMRAYYSSKDATQRAAALTCFGSVLVYMMQAWGDLGLSAWAGVFCVGGSLAVAGKLAVANDQWGAAKKQSRLPRQDGFRPHDPSDAAAQS